MIINREIGHSGGEVVGLRPMTTVDIGAVAALHARVFGPGRFARTAFRVREGATAFSRYCRLAVRDDTIVGAVTFTPISIGEVTGGLLLGPLAVVPDAARVGLGRQLIEAGVEAAQRDGMQLVVLVGDMAYYERCGFVRVAHGHMVLPGPVDPDRLLVRELVRGSAEHARGLVQHAPDVS